MTDVKLRAGHYIILQKLLITFNSFNDTTSAAEIETNLDRAEKTWKKIEEAHDRIIAITDEPDIDIQMTALEPIEKCYMDIKKKVYEIKSAKPTPPRFTQPTGSFKLPDIAAPSFDGRFEDWPSFSDSFNNAIGNNTTLSGGQKLQYLKSMVKGEAANLIKSFSVTDVNFSEAWTLLNERYDNKREIIHSNIKKLLFQPSIKSESVTALEQLLNTTMEILRSLKAMGQPTDQWDNIITVLLTEKLDADSRAEWARSLKGTDPPTLKEVQEFMERHIRTLRARGTVKPPSNRLIHQQQKQLNTHHAAVSTICTVCQSSHPLYLCPSFKQMDVEKRSAVVKSASLCFNCLRAGHSSRDCNSRHMCRLCNKRHNSMLHQDQPSYKRLKPNEQSSSSSGVDKASESINICNAALGPSSTLLKTALVDVEDTHSVRHQLRVFIDDGGEGSLIREATINKLGLRKQRTSVEVTGVGGIKAMHSKWKTHVRLYSKVNKSFLDVELFVVPKLTNEINRVSSNKLIEWKHVEGLELADPLFHKAGEVDILLGMDAAPYILTGEIRHSTRNQPVAQNTIFGWVLGGNVANEPHKIIRTHHVSCHVNDILRKFWELEEIPHSTALTLEEEACEKHFRDTHQRLKSGRYMVRLPFNDNQSKIGSTREQALYRLQQLERRFLRHPDKKAEYIKFMREYESMNHMEKVSSHHQSSNQPVYLPHHFVIKEDSTTTKQRTVFDGSAKSSTGVSLNSTLLVGATLQPDLYTLLLRFRMHKIALKADIAKMYRQFLVHPDDTDFQRILWREDPSSPVLEYNLTTVTYGTACAPFLATRCLIQLASDEQVNCPLAAQAINENMYIDDYVGGQGSREKAVKLVNEMIKIVSSAGMEIRKWCSNDQAVLEHIPVELREEEASFEIDDGEHGSIKALGIRWHSKSDTFGFKVNVNLRDETTKRSMLSEIAKTFDPLGWLSPVTIRAKLLLQQVWLEGLQWDDMISEELQLKWNMYQAELPQVEKVQVPRCVIHHEIISAELHGFCDSSELAYASAIYLKCIYVDGTVSVNLLTSKTKVAPLKAVSLPKLELCGADTLSETMEAVQKAINIPIIVKIYCWTDSTITLSWITSHSRKWKTFVANRVSSIQSRVAPENWYHVKSEENPADLPSRGISAASLKDSTLWWNGPAWLTTDNYPIHHPQANEEDVKKEERSKQLTCHHHAINHVRNKLFNAFSSFNKLCRVTVYLFRFIQFIKNKTVNNQFITTAELKRAKLLLVKWSQQVSYSEEYAMLLKQQHVKSSSKLLLLNPYIDSDGVIRVGGRIHNSNAAEATKHPIVLDHSHQLTKLIVTSVHLCNIHSGFTLTLTTIRRDYWITRGRDIIRHIINKCVTCRRNKAAATSQLMGNLPVARVTASRPFLHCGVDYAGPFPVKLRKGRHVPVEKAYLCIFVCLSTKAVHLESVNNLTTDSFIAALERLSARRGVPATMYSDCGTNFVGANRILQQFLKNEQSRIASGYANRGTQWIFNPPAAPHQGGLWEAGVKAVKHHFKRVVGSSPIMLDQFQTLLCKIESCLNSRPLCALSADPTDVDALTPGHFLIGEAINAIPEPDCRMVKENRLDYWNLVRQKSQHFWDRWATEYLTSLQQRFKWKHKRDNMQVGDLVVIRDELMPLTKWKLGRIIKTHPGKDGLVRSVTLKTATGESTRPITKLSLLISIDEQS